MSKIILPSSDDGALPPPSDGSVGDASLAPSRSERRTRLAGTNRARRAIKAEQAATRTWMDRVADHLTRVASSTPFLVAHFIWFAGWIAWNAGVLGLPAFDPYPFGFLTLIVSLEAIFLSIFVLMSQAREARIAELREEISLQVTLRMEEEVTKTLQLVAGLYARLGLTVGQDADLSDMLRPLDAERIEQDLIDQLRRVDGGQKRPKIITLKD
jgi:uncharacterized membrane protein